MPDPMRDALYAADLPHLESLGLPSIDENDWQGLMNILQNPWFTRVWVIQELALARDCFSLLGP